MSKGREKKLYPSLPGGLLSVTTALASGISLGDCGVSDSHIEDSAVTTAKINDCAVTTAKINDSAVTYAKIQTVTAARLLGRHDALAGVVQEIALGTNLSFDSTTGVLNAASADTSHDDCSIETAQIGDSAITTVKLKDSSVTSAKLADSAVLTIHIPDSQITTAKINADAVTYPKIQNVTASRLLGRFDTTDGDVQEVLLSSELRFDTDNDWLEISDCGVTASLLKDSAVSTVKLLDSAVTTVKIADSNVTTAKILDSNVTTAKINDGAITRSKDYDTDNQMRVIEVHISDTTLTVGDTFATFFIPAEFNNFDLVRAEMCAKISSTTGNPTIQIRDVTGTGDMLSTKITLDTGEKTSYTAATPSVVDTGNDTVVTGTEIAVDVDSAGTAEDVYLILSFKKP